MNSCEGEHILLDVEKTYINRCYVHYQQSTLNLYRFCFDVFCIYFSGCQHQSSAKYLSICSEFGSNGRFSHNTQIIGGNWFIGCVTSMKSLQLLKLYNCCGSKTCQSRVFWGFFKYLLVNRKIQCNNLTMLHVAILGPVWANLSRDRDWDVLWLWRLPSHKQGRLQPWFLQMLQGGRN